MTKKRSNVSEAILQKAGGQLRTGLIDKATGKKITVRMLGAQALSTAKPISGDEIRRLRERADVSRTALARSLNLSVGYISQLERGAKQLKGPALVLLNVIRRKGFEAIL
ncbi:MAG: helix-turn-helix domain-containing protein [Terracidiphilus sp.]